MSYSKTTDESTLAM